MVRAPRRREFDGMCAGSGSKPPPIFRLVHTNLYARDMLLRDRIVAGERAAAETLLAEHLDPLVQFVHFRLGGDAHGVEDLVQDTFLVALERMGGFDGRSSLHTWLCGIAKNKIRDARRARRPQSLQDALLEADPEIEAILAQIAREPLPEHVLELAETRDLVGATLSSLPPDYAQALVQKYVEGRSVAEIARDAKKGDKAIESVLTRARAAFARVFELLAEKRGGLR
jgi:RNA polymerase sigma-70 factor (ECF subfamily)